MNTHLQEVTTTAALAEKKKLRKGLWRFDMICYTVVAIIAINVLGAFASNGAQAFTWLVISGITFFLPYGLLVAELGSTFPQEASTSGVNWQEGASTLSLRPRSTGSPSRSSSVVRPW